MEGSKEYFVRMREEEYNAFPQKTRESFLSEKVIYPDEHQKLWDTDEHYRKIYSSYSKAKKALDNYKFDKRYANNRSDTK